MPVTAVILDTDGLSATLTGLTDDQLAGELESTYIVDVDSASDTGIAVTDYFRTHPDLPYNGRLYRVGNDAAQFSKCDRLHVEPIKGTQKTWRAKAHFSNSAADQNGSNNQRKPHRQKSTPEKTDQTDDPIFWETDIRITPRQIDDYDTQLVYLGGISNPAGVVTPGKPGPFVNAALDPMVSRPPWRRFQTVYDLARYDTQAHQWTEKRLGCVNLDSSLTLESAAYGIQRFFEKGTLLLAAITSERVEINQTRCWRISGQFIHDPKTWDLEVLNWGYRGRAEVGLRNMNKTGGAFFASGDEQLESGFYNILDFPSASGGTDSKHSYINSPRFLNDLGEPNLPRSAPTFIKYRNVENSDFLQEIIDWFLAT